MGQLIEVVVESVRVHMLTNRHVVFLKDAERQRYLPIWIGAWEASAIAMRLQGVAAERPLTHDLFVAALAGLDVRVDRVVVTALAGETYHARLILAPATGGPIEVDARPSDALAIALRAGCPIYADEAVLAAAALPADPEAGDDAGEDAERRMGRRTRPAIETLEGGVADERLDLFRDFVNSLDQDRGEGGRRT